MMLDPDKTKLSKRKHGKKVSVTYYREAGYLPEAVINYLAMVGWNPGGEQEIFSMEELIKIFDVNKVQKKGGIFNIEKLDWMNREYILQTSGEEQFSIFTHQLANSKWKDSEKTKDTEFTKKLFKIIMDRIHRWGEVREIADNGEFDYLFEKPILDKEKIAWKKQSQEGAKENLKKVLEIIENKEKVAGLAEREGKGEVLWPLRYSLSGREKSPDPFTLLDILGPEDSRARIENAVKILSN
jgi:glutamyl/glutaminyl-tRNA synthetase